MQSPMSITVGTGMEYQAALKHFRFSWHSHRRVSLPAQPPCFNSRLGSGDHLISEADDPVADGQVRQAPKGGGKSGFGLGPSPRMPGRTSLISLAAVKQSTATVDHALEVDVIPTGPVFHSSACLGTIRVSSLIKSNHFNRFINQQSIAPE
jgi:hypothetical protein